MGTNGLAGGGFGAGGGGGTLAYTGVSTGMWWLTLLGAMLIVGGIVLLTVGSVRSRRDRALVT